MNGTMIVKFDDVTVNIDNEMIKGRIKRYLLNKGKKLSATIHNKHWTEDEIQALKNLLAEGHNKQEIAELLGRPLGAINMRVWQLERQAKKIINL